jgi:predicted phage terminase large subunit-like protein
MAALTVDLPDVATLDRGALRSLRAQLARELAESDLEQTRANADAIRGRCRTLAGFVKEAWHVLEPRNPLKWSWHLQAMCDHLEAITRGQMTPWLIINVPPGSSKSMIVSVMWQAWVWGPFGNAASRWVSSSFDLANVTRDTRKTRDLILSDWYRELWPEVFDRSGKLKRAGETSFENHDFGFRQGVAFAAITGKRGDVVIIDDPHSVDGAESETERTGTVRKFIEGGLNRSNDAETSAMVIVMQRIHQDDLTGALLARDFGFVHLMIPMEFEVERKCETPLRVDVPGGGKKNWCDPRSYEGELMDPVRMPPTAIARQKKAGDYVWAGQYQQSPAPREGGMFKVDLIETVPVAPGGGKIVAGWDIAGSKRKNSPFTVRTLMKRVGGDYYILHVDRRRTNPTELNKMVEVVTRQDTRDYGPRTLHSLPQDPGATGKVVKWNWAELLAGLDFEITPESGDKETRAEPFAAMVGAGRVFMVKGDWNSAYREELRNFPAGSYKDQVDASSRAFGKLVPTDRGGTNAGPEIVEPGSDEERLAAMQAAGEDVEDPWGAY